MSLNTKYMEDVLAAIISNKTEEEYKDKSELEQLVMDKLRQIADSILRC